MRSPEPASIAPPAQAGDDLEDGGGSVPAPQLGAARDTTRFLTRMINTSLMYGGVNEAVVRARQEVRKAFSTYSTTYGTLRWRIESDTIRLGREPIHVEKGRENSLATRLYRDGVRELRFHEGLADDEVLRFADVLVEALRYGERTEDLVSTLWRQDFEAIDYRVVDELSKTASADPGAQGPVDILEQGEDDHVGVVGGSRTRTTAPSSSRTSWRPSGRRGSRRTRATA